MIAVSHTQMRPNPGNAAFVEAGHQRVAASAKAAVKCVHGKTRLDRLYQLGSAKIRFPATHRDELEAVLINTAGGLTGGDRLGWQLDLGEDAQLVATTQACEKAYRSTSGTAHLSTQIHIGKRSTLHWLPQETILYEGSKLKRRFDVTMAKGATLVALEAVMMGRASMGEEIETLFFKDEWRITCDEKLIFADHLKFDDAGRSRAQLAENAAFASLLYVSNETEDQLAIKVDQLRKHAPIKRAGFSVVEGKITGRFLAKDTYHLRKLIIPIIAELRGAPLPRLWRT